MDGNGGGVIFAGEGRDASTDNLVEHNIISRSRLDHNITEWWGDVVGRNNVARDNCLFAGRDGVLSRSPDGYVATGNTVADPQYVDADAHDYRLKPSSPCLPVVGYDVAARLQDGAAATAAAVAPAPAPTVEIVAPATDTTFGKVLRVVGSGDSKAVTRVELWIDGRLRARAGQGQWRFKVGAKRMRAGRHRVTLRAFSAAGARASDSVLVRKRRSRR
jgi:hypothetical protein